MSTKQESLIYHPKQVPIDIKRVREMKEARCECVGELAVHCSTGIPVGTQVLLSLPTSESDASLCGCVVWLSGAGSDYLIGVTFFGEEEAYKMRMVEQLCHIQAYQHTVSRQEGRLLSDEDAAREWIGRYSKDFPEVVSVHLL